MTDRPVESRPDDRPWPPPPPGPHRRGRGVALLAGLIAVALGLLGAGWLIGAGLPRVNRQDVVTVTGSAKQSVAATKAVWTIQVVAQAVTPQEASSTLTGRVDAVRSFLRGAGLSGRAVSVGSISTEIQNEYLNGNPTGRVLGYALRRPVTVTSTDLDRVQATAARVQTLLEQGVPVQADPVQYLVGDLTEVRRTLLRKAVADAKARALVMVQGAGGHLGGIRSVRQGVFQITAASSTEVSDYGVNDTSTRQKDVTAVVGVTFTVS